MDMWIDQFKSFSWGGGSGEGHGKVNDNLEIMLINAKICLI